MKLSISGVCIDLTGEEEIEVSAEKCKKDGNYYLFFISSFYKRELTIWGGKHHMEQIINSLQKMLAEDKE